ncbi:M16 family metallopeptidase [Ornithinimicrobium sp.]|uniref:M16 family metallopeptidase n=1 Tax=Ornithinimicrobium sp. TaxID=1977084 RepID=UPI002B489DC9|nr:insulinase family protein [Ornithinimicrobium sp.]
MPARPWSLPAHGRHPLDGGADLVTLDLPGQHVLSLRVGLPAPLAAEPRELEGVAWMVTRGLDEGTSRYSAQELAEVIESHGIALGAGIGEQGLVIEMEVTAAHFRAAVGLLAHCLTEASYPDAVVARLQRARLSEIDHARADAAARGGMEFARAYFHPEDRASRLAGGEPESVARIGSQDVRGYYASVMQPRNAVLVLAGDLAGLDSDPVGVVGEGLAGWTARPSSVAAASERSEVPVSGARGEDAAATVLVDRPGSAQSFLYLGRPGPTRRTPHGWGAYQVLAFLLGGSPQSRIDAVLREERGYTYGMRAGFRPRRDGGVCHVSGSVRAEATAEALAALREVLDVSGEGLSEQEVRHAADFVAKTAPGRYSTADSVANELVRLALDDLGPEFVTGTVETSRTLTRQAAAAAWDEVAGGPGWTTVVVGDAERHLTALERLGPVRVVPTS